MRKSYESASVEELLLCCIYAKTPFSAKLTGKDCVMNDYS